MRNEAVRLQAIAPDFDGMAAKAKEASEFLKALAHESRLMILSQQLARLRADGLVAARRSGKAIHYSIASENARIIVGAVHEVFCKSVKS